MNARAWLRAAEAEALAKLDLLRRPLFEEMRRLSKRPAGPPHACCKRERNQMRISPLEARSIAEAFRRDRELRKHRAAVLARLEGELPRLENSTERQGFDCPLLEGTRCLVHDVAKPIGCLAWNDGREYSAAAWNAFARRDALNDAVYGPDWKLRVIPLWLRRVFGRVEVAGSRKRPYAPKG